MKKQQAFLRRKCPCLGFIIIITIIVSSLSIIQVTLAKAERRHFNRHSASISPAFPAADTNNSHNNHNHASNTQDDNQEPSALAGGASSSNLAPDSGESAGDQSNYQVVPTDLQAVRLNDNSIVLRWDHGVVDNLQFFKIQYKSTKKDAAWKTENKEILATARAYQINGLRPGAYFFIVVAVYDNDDHVSSEQLKYKLRAQSKIKPDEMPELKAPVINWSESEADFIRFKWKYDFKDQDMEWFGFLVYYRSAHQISDFHIYHTLDENVEIYYLEPDTPYEAKVLGYNRVAVSEFSELIQIKTKPNSTATTNSSSPIATTTTITTLDSQTITTTVAPVTSTTTRKPNSFQVTGSPSQESSSVAATTVSVATHNNVFHPPVVPAQTTQKPVSVVPSITTTIVTAINSNSTSNSSSYHSFASIIELLTGGQQNDTTLAIRYSIIVLLPILFIVFASICLISCHHHRKDSAPASTHDSMQFDLEINGYFKNSFPGVGNNEYHTPTANHQAHPWICQQASSYK